MPTTSAGKRSCVELAAFLRGARLLVVLGVGSELKGDDAAGILVARALTGKSERLVALEGHTAPEAMAGKVVSARPSHFLIADAAELGLRPGQWRLVERDEVDDGFTSTHHIPLTKIAAHVEESCGCRVGFLGIQVVKRGVGLDLSPSATRAAAEVARAISEVLEKSYAYR